MPVFVNYLYKDVYSLKIRHRLYHELVKQIVNSFIIVDPV